MLLVTLKTIYIHNIHLLYHTSVPFSASTITCIVALILCAAKKGMYCSYNVVNILPLAQVV